MRYGPIVSRKVRFNGYSEQGNRIMHLARVMNKHCLKQGTAIVRVPAATYARGRRGQSTPWHQNKEASMGEVRGDESAIALDSEILEEHAAALHGISSPPEQSDRDPIALQKRNMFQTIQRKYFKEPQELNLLTWDAKEQIRYLHAEYPDQWTVDELSNSFPITRGGVLKLLKSQYTPKTWKEVIKHDRRVRTHWLELQSGEKAEGGPIAQRYQQLLESGKLELLRHASGNLSLPAPAANSLPAPVHSSRVITDGASDKCGSSFLSIVKDYCDRQKAEDIATAAAASDPKTVLQENKEENKNALEVVVTSSHSSNLQSSLNTNFKYQDQVLHRAQEPLEQDNLDHLSINETMFDHFERLSQESAIADRRSGLKTLRRRHNQSDDIIENSGPRENNIDTLEGFKGTVKLKKGGIDHDIDEGSDRPYLDRSTVNRSEEEKDFLKSVQYDTHRARDGREHQVAFVYDDVDGYVHPYGKPSDLPTEKIEVSHKQTRDDAYQKGKDFYDAEGNFIFRVP